MKIWRMRIACWINKTTDTHTLALTTCNTYCFSTATIGTRRHLNVTLYVHRILFNLKAVRGVILKLTPERNQRRFRKARAGFRGGDSSDGSILGL